MSWRRVLLGFFGLLALAAIAVVWTLPPPAPLVLPPQGVVLSNVTVINPGVDRRAGRSLRIEGGRVASIADGRVYTMPQLTAQLARYREYFEGALYDPISVALVRRALARILD